MLSELASSEAPNFELSHMHFAIAIVFALLTAHLPVPPNLAPPAAAGFVPIDGVRI
jgi:H+/gluconate symporter-like permease